MVEAALKRPGTRRITVTDAGWFPEAIGHLRRRNHGSAELITLLCIGGQGTVVIRGEAHPLTAGSWVSIPPGVPHEYRSSVDHPWTIWWLHVRGSDVADLGRGALGLTAPVAHLKSMDRVVALFDEVVTLLERPTTPAHLLAASGAAWHLLAQLAVDAVMPAEDSPLERAMRYLEARVESNIRVAELAALVGLSPSHLSALFRQATGEGPGAFHTSLKMSRARVLLDTSAMLISEVATSVGYADPLYFSRHFRRVHGVNPSQYRARSKG